MVRDEYQPAMEAVRSGEIPFCRLDVLHRRNLERILPRFGLSGLSGAVLTDLNLAWHRLDAWEDVPPGLKRLRVRFRLAPVTESILDRAADPFPTALGSLDAIHLATALELREQVPSLVFATHDRDLAIAAQSVGFSIAGV